MLPASAPGLQSSADASVDSATKLKADRRSDFGKGSEGEVAYWVAEIKASEKETMQWRQVAARVVKRYRDERQQSALTGAEKKYNILWSNINTTMPAVYGKDPEPVVMRRFTDPDNVARVASIILERCLEFQICTQHDFNSAIKNALQDRLLPGMGSVWVRYQKGQESPTGTIDGDYYARLSGNLASVDYVYWEDLGFVPSRTWEEVPAVWRIVYMNRDQLVERFGEKIGSEVPLDYIPARHPTTNDATTETDEPKNVVFRQAKIYEIWDKRTSKVYWLNTHYPKLLDSADDPIKFPGFFPCPKPMFATNTTGNLVPVPDYFMYQDQAYELDNLTQRLNMLTKALKVVGVYDAEQLAIQRMLTEGIDNQLIPVDTWAAFAEKGGIKGVVDFLPLDVIIVVVEKLFNIRQQLIQDIYQITGLSDIIRGASNPRETLGAQKIKAQFASTRLDAMKHEMARFVTDTLRLMAHIMVEFFDDQTLIDQSSILQSPDGQKAVKDAQAAMAARAAPPPPMPGAAPPMGSGGPPAGAPPAPSGPPAGMVPPIPPLPGMGGGGPNAGMGGNVVPFPSPPPPQQENVIQSAIALLRKGKLADFRIMVAADTLVEADLEEDRNAANAFLTGVTQFLQQALPAAEANPGLAPLLNTLLMFGIRNFRMGRDIEGQIESAMQELASAPPKEPPPDPKLEAVKAKAQSDQAAQQADMQATMMKLQGEQKAAQEESQRKMTELQAELQADRERNAEELRMMREKNAAEIEAILIKANIQAETAQQKMVQDSQQKAMEGQQSLSFQQAAHDQSMEHAAETQAAETAAHEATEAAAEKKGEGE